MRVAAKRIFLSHHPRATIERQKPRFDKAYYLVRKVKLLILLALTSCSPVREPRVVWACTATHECDGPPVTESFEMCGTDDEVEKNESGWTYACQDAAGIYGCGVWECAETCTPTPRPCGGSDTSLP